MEATGQGDSRRILAHHLITRVVESIFMASRVLKTGGEPGVGPQSSSFQGTDSRREITPGGSTLSRPKCFNYKKLGNRDTSFSKELNRCPAV